jgi:hypothetical protein
MSEEYRERPVTDDEVRSVITELATADAYGFTDRVSAGQALRRAVDLIERLIDAKRPTQVPPAAGEVGELIEGLKLISDGMDAMGHESDSWFVARAADLLERLASQSVLRAGGTPSDEEIVQWANQCADATRAGTADHFWAFDVTTDHLVDVVKAALVHFANPPG